MPQIMFMNQSNNFINFGGNMNNPLIGSVNPLMNNNLINQPFPNPNFPMMNNNFMFPFNNMNMGNPNLMMNNQNMFFNQMQNFFNNNDTQIFIYFRFVTNPKSFKVNAKLSEKLVDIIDRFEKSECPKELKNCLSVCACNGNRADKNKTLIELGINNGDSILFMDKFAGNDQTVYKETKKNEYALTEKEKIQYDRLKSQYEARLFIKSAFKNKFVSQQAAGGNNNNNNNDEPTQSFSDFMKEIDNSVGIIVNEHKHILVYCLTINDWKCNICNTNNTKDKGRYYCSVCDYNMCETCHGKNKYFMKKSFPQGTKPSNSQIKDQFLNSDYHEHRLVFCRSSRKFEFFNGYNCSNCLESYDNDIWLFYCTLCDYNLCLKCCGYQ